MTKKISSLFLAMFLSFFTIADEGMWLPHLLNAMNEEDMRTKGLRLTKEDLYSINNSSLKDAIVSINWGSCTGEMISSEGLMLTNHHCAYGDIQEHSSISNDYLKDGFWAMNREEELPNEGLSVSFLISVENVSEKITSNLNGDMNEQERRLLVREISNENTSQKKEGTH